jgi:hypothetical protein
VAASFGSVASALSGVAGALFVVALWSLLFPDLYRVNSISPKQS